MTIRVALFEGYPESDQAPIAEDSHDESFSTTGAEKAAGGAMARTLLLTNYPEGSEPLPRILPPERLTDVSTVPGTPLTGFSIGHDDSLLVAIAFVDDPNREPAPKNEPGEPTP